MKFGYQYIIIIVNRVGNQIKGENMEVERNIIFMKAGGNASKTSYGYKLAMPAAAIKALGVTKEDRAVIVKIEEDKVIIEKKKINSTK